MYKLILTAALILILVAVGSSYSAFAYNDPKHCHVYDACFNIGYEDGYSDTQMGQSPAYACVGHSQGWCSGYNEGFRAGNGGSNIFYSPNGKQSAGVDVHGNNNKISIDQQTNNQVGDNGGISSDHTENSRTGPPNCVVLCLNSNINIK